jgi:hypothetical protein
VKTTDNWKIELALRHPLLNNQENGASETYFQTEFKKYAGLKNPTFKKYQHPGNEIHQFHRQPNSQKILLIQAPFIQHSCDTMTFLRHFQKSFQDAIIIVAVHPESERAYYLFPDKPQPGRPAELRKTLRENKIPFFGYFNEEELAFLFGRKVAEIINSKKQND